MQKKKKQQISKKSPTPQEQLATSQVGDPQKESYIQQNLETFQSTMPQQSFDEIISDRIFEIKKKIQYIKKLFPELNLDTVKITPEEIFDQDDLRLFKSIKSMLSPSVPLDLSRKLLQNDYPITQLLDDYNLQCALIDIEQQFQLALQDEEFFYPFCCFYTQLWFQDAVEFYIASGKSKQEKERLCIENFQQCSINFMVPVKIKFSKSVRSNSPLQKTRILNKNGNDSFHNIKNIPIKIKKDEQLRLQQYLKGSEEYKNNEQKNNLKSDLFQHTNSEVFRQTQRSTSNNRKQQLNRVINKQGEFCNKNVNSYHNNSLCSSETTNDYEVNESPAFIKANNVNQKRLVATVNIQQNNLLNPSNSPPLNKLYKIYGQVSQDSEESAANLQNQQEIIKQNLNIDKKEFQSIITLKNKDNSFKTQSDFKKKNEEQKIQNETQKQLQISDSQVNSRKLKQAEQVNEISNQPSDIKKRIFITKVDTTSFSLQKNLDNNFTLEQQITQKQQLPQQNSPNFISRKQKDPFVDQQSDKETIKSSTGRQKRKSQVKQKKPKANKQLLLQNELANNNTNSQSHYNPYQNSFYITERNNIQLNKIMQVQTNNQMSPTQRASQFFNQQIQDFFFQYKKQTQEENRPQSLSQQTPKQQTINLPAIYSSLKNDQQSNQDKQFEQSASINQNRQEQKQSNSKENESFSDRQMQKIDSPLNNKQNMQISQQSGSFKKQSVQIQKSSTSSRQQSLQIQKQQQPNQQDSPKNELQNHSSKLKSQSKEITGANQTNSSISSIQNGQNINNQDLKCSQKIFYDLPPQYSNRIKFRRLHKVYFKPRNYFRGNQLAILHFNGVLGIYENSFFKPTKNSIYDIPQADEQNIQYKPYQVNQSNDQEESLIQEDENKSEIEGLTNSQFKDITQVQTKQCIAEEKKSNSEYQQGEDDQEYDDTNSRFNQEQLHILQNLKQTLKKISQWYYVILILPQKSALWLEIRDYLVQQHYYCDAMYSYDNQTHDYTSYYKRNIDNLDLLNPEFKVQNDNIEFIQKKGVAPGNKTFSQNMYNPQADKFKQQQQKDNNLSFQGTFYPSNNMKNSKDSDSNNSSFNNVSENVSNLDLELLIDYNQILADLKLSQPKKVLLIDTLPLSMRECYTKVEDRATFLQNEQKQDDLIHNIQFLKLNQKIWKSFSLKFPKIKCQRSALRVVFLPSLYYEQKKFSSNSISFHQVLLEEIASEFQEEANECRYISRNKQRWYYLNLKDVFSELENQKLKECFEKHMKSGQIENVMKQPQTSIYKQEQEAQQISELNLKQKIYRYFSQNYKTIELLSKDMEKQINSTTDNSQIPQQQQQQPNQIQGINNNINYNTSNNFFPNGINKKQSLIFQQYFNNIVESIIIRNNKIIKQFSQNKEEFNQALTIQKIYSSFYDKTNHCISKKQQQEKVEKELDLYIARKYKSSILFYFSNFQNILTISLFFFMFFVSLLK
ncbi:hypothetical protein ABPG72_020782 [Tetrahymena utriculariae]